MANSKPTAPTPIRKRLRASALWYPALATATSYTEARQVPLLRLSGDWLAAEPRIRIVKPAGAFYLFPDVSEFLSPDTIRTTAELAQVLLDEARVAITPGEAFDSPGFFRLSYATSMTDLERGTARILEFMRALETRGAVARA